MPVASAGAAVAVPAPVVRLAMVCTGGPALTGAQILAVRGAVLRAWPGHDSVENSHQP